MAIQEAETVELSEDRLLEDAAEAMESVEDQATIDLIRRRVDRQLGLLKALPDGWRVVRKEDRTVGRFRGHTFFVEDEAGVRGSAGRTQIRDEASSRVSWGGTSGGTAGDAWATGIALLFAALDAEARAEPSEREVH